MSDDQTPKPEVKLIDYFAHWCGPCKAMEPVFEAITEEYKGKIDLEKVDVDKEVDRANAAGVMSIPTLHIIKGDKIVQVLIGYQSKEDLSKHIDAALA